MGKTPRSAQNDEVPEETQRATRRRPEDIVAGSFPTPVATEINGGDGWSPKARRLFLTAMAVVGALVVTVGLLLTGELGPGPGNPRPLETGPGSGAVNFLPTVDQPAAPPASAPPTASSAPSGPTPRAISPVLATPSQSADEAQPPQATPTTAAPSTQTTTPPPKSPTTTAPCRLLGSKELGAQLPPLCR